MGRSLAFGGEQSPASAGGSNSLDAFLALKDNFSGSSYIFADSMAARQAGLNPMGLPASTGNASGDTPANAFDYRNGGDIASDSYDGSRRTATVRNGQVQLASLADFGLNSAQQLAGYGYLLKTGQVQLGRNGVPMVQPGQQLHIDMNQAGLAGRVIAQESSMRADRAAAAAQAATDSYANAEARRFANPPPSLMGSEAMYGAGAGRVFTNLASAGLSTAERVGLIARGGGDAVMGAVEARATAMAWWERLKAAPHGPFNRQKRALLDCVHSSAIRRAQ